MRVRLLLPDANLSIRDPNYTVERETPMSTKNDYNVDEWKAISSAPVAAGLLITLSDASGPVGITKEAMAVSNAITDSAKSEVPEVVKSLAASMKESGHPATPDIPAGNRLQYQAALMASITNAVEAVARHSPSEVQAFKTWVASVGRRVAEASKEGGFFGVGGTLVSSDEVEGLKQLDAALGLRA